MPPGDLRYYRNFQDSDEGFFSLERGTLEFTRATVGLALRF